MIGTTRQSLLAALFVVTPLASQALMVTIEPDDYAIGTDLSHISPYVSLYKMETLQGNATYLGPARSELVSGLNNNQFNPPAPTGDQTFGNYGYGIGLWGTAFGIALNVPVTNLTLYANNMYPPGVSTNWRIFDASGAVIGGGSAGYKVPYGENFEVKIKDTANMALIVLGADDGGNTTRFDRLTFEVDDRYVAVPEPSALFLLGAGLVGVLATRKRSARR